MTAHDSFQPVTEAEPCVICGKPDWCRRTADGADECHRINESAVNGYVRIAQTSAGFAVYRHPEDRPSPIGRTSAANAKRPTIFDSLEAAAESFARWKGGIVERTYRWSDSWCRARIRLPNGKTFCEITRNGTGWALRGPPKPHPLYRVGELPPHGIIIVCEGEKACDAGWSIGLSCTTSGAADSARSADWTSLRGREVAIFPDRDAAGTRYAVEVARQLKALDHAASVKIVELPGLGEGEDLHDFINEQRDSREADEIKAEINALVARTPPYDRPRTPGETTVHSSPRAKSNNFRPRPLVRCVADVQPEAVEWLWHNRIALGKVTLIVGDPDLGKSFVTLDIAARVSSGRALPDTPAIPNPAGGVILLSAEDDVADTIRPRLDAAGADVRRIVVLDAVADSDDDGGLPYGRVFNLNYDVGALEQAIEHVPGCRLVIVDPITAYCGQVDSHNNTEVRGLLAPLSSLAAKRRVAIVCVTHLNKSSGRSALYRAMGSLAFTAAARAVWTVAKDPRNAARRLMVRAKNNLARDLSGLAYQLVPASGNQATAVVQWETDPVSLSADEALAASWSGQKPTERDAAAEWLRDLLAPGPMAVVDVRQNAEDAGFTFATLRRAKGSIGVNAVKAGFEGGWLWQLPGHSENGPGPRCSPTPFIEQVSASGKSERLRFFDPENSVVKPTEDAQANEGAHLPEGAKLDNGNPGPAAFETQANRPPDAQMDLASEKEQ